MQYAIRLRWRSNRNSNPGYDLQIFRWHDSVRKIESTRENILSIEVSANSIAGLRDLCVEPVREAFDRAIMNVATHPDMWVTEECVIQPIKPWEVTIP